MNILIVAIGSQGDVNPFIKIGMTLQKRGHDVTILSNNYFRDSVQNSGLGFASVGSREEYNKMVDEVDTNNPTKTTKVVMKYLYFASMQKVYETIKKLNIPGETIVLGITMAFGARIARDELDIPLITCHLAPISIPSVSRPAKLDGLWMPHWMPEFYKAGVWRLIDILTDPFLAPPINRMRKALGLPKVKSIIRQWIHSPDKVIGLFPDWFAEPQPDWPKNTQVTNFLFFDESDDKPIPPGLEKFIAGGKPPVVFTAGTAVSDAASFFKASEEACGILNSRGVLLSRYKEDIPDDLPPNIFHCDYAPFSKLFPHASAVVHHGGIGTCAQALRAGIPQLVTPFGMDQPDNASRLKEFGVSDELRLKKYISSTVADKLGKLLGDKEVHTRCKKFAEKFKNVDPVGDICRIIEDQMESFKSMQNSS
jgi:rhamnosyltransferase subunit B